MQDSIPELATENLIITVLKPTDFRLLVRYEKENRAHLSKWEPTRGEEFFSDESAKSRLNLGVEHFKRGLSVPLVGLDKSRAKIVCVCHFTNIVRGAFQACQLGYSINAQDEGKGLMFEMLQASIEYVFSECALHRIMANYIPANERSEKLLIRLGFEKEGIAKSYLKIAGSWQDHVLTSKINPSHMST